MKKKNLWLAMAGILSVSAVAGVVVAQTTVDGQPSSVNQTPKTSEVPDFMQTMNAPTGSDANAVPASPVSSPAISGTPAAAMDSGSLVAPVTAQPNAEPMAAPTAPTISGMPTGSVAPNPALPVGVPTPFVDGSISGASMLGSRPQAGMSFEEKRYFEEQSKLQRDTALMAARVKLAKEQAEYNKTVTEMISASPAQAMNSSGQSAANVNQPSGANGKPENKAPPSDLASEMILVSVYGEGKNLTGEVFYRGGRITVNRGDKLPGNFLVTKIEPTRIVVRHNKVTSDINLGRPTATN